MNNLVCRYFVSPTGCYEGPLCHFPHVISSNRTPDTICRYFLVGKCAFGDQCWHHHVPLSAISAATSFPVESLPQSIPTRVHVNYQHASVYESGTYSSVFPDYSQQHIVDNLPELTSNPIPPVADHSSIQELPNCVISPPQVPLSNRIQPLVDNNPGNSLQVPQAIYAWQIVRFVWELPGIEPESVERNTVTFNKEEQYENDYYDLDSGTSNRGTSKTSNSSIAEISDFSYQNEDDDFCDSIEEGNLTTNNSNAVNSQESLFSNIGSQSTKYENSSSAFPDNSSRPIPVNYHADQQFCRYFGTQPVMVENDSSQTAVQSGFYNAYGSEINYLPVQPDACVEFSYNNYFPNLGNPNNRSGDNNPVTNLEVNRSNSASEGYPINLRAQHDDKFTEESKNGSHDFYFYSETTNGSCSTLRVEDDASKHKSSLSLYPSKENVDQAKFIDDTNNISCESKDGSGENKLTSLESNAEMSPCSTPFNKDSEHQEESEKACAKVKRSGNHTYKEAVVGTREKFELLRSDISRINMECDVKYNSRNHSSHDPALGERTNNIQKWYSSLKNQYQVRRKENKHIEKETSKDIREPSKPSDRPKYSAEGYSMPASILRTNSSKLLPPSQSDTKVPVTADTDLFKKINSRRSHSTFKHKLEYVRSEGALELPSSSCEELASAVSFQNGDEVKCPSCFTTIKFRRNKSNMVYGILENCNHIHCMECLRFRRQKETRKDYISCSQCNKTSRFIIPVNTLIRSVDEKNEIVGCYAKTLKYRLCRLYRSDWGTCKRGDTCPYFHPGAKDTFRYKKL